MKITDCNTSREAQTALYKRGFKTVEQLEGSGMNGIGGEFPQNLYDYILGKLIDNSSSAMKKRPFNGVSCTANVLYLINQVVTSEDETLSDEEKKLLTLRFIKLYTIEGIAENMGISVSTVNSKINKSISLIVKYLCIKYDSNDIGDSSLSENAIEALKSIGMSELSDIQRYKRISGALSERLSSLVWNKKLSKEVFNEISSYVEMVSGGSISVVYKQEDDIEKNYPSNIYIYILANIPNDVLCQKPFISSEKTTVESIIKGIVEVNKEGILDSKDLKILNCRFKDCWTLDMIEADSNIIKSEVRNCIDTAVQKIVDKIYDIYYDSDSLVNSRKYHPLENILFEKGIYTEKDYNSTIERIKAGDLIEDWESYLRLTIDLDSESSLSDEEVINKFGDKALGDVISLSYIRNLDKSIYNRLIKNGIGTVRDIFLTDREALLKVKGMHRREVYEINALKREIRKYADVELLIDSLKNK